MRNIILASTSPYRRELLKQLNLPFEAATPLFTETVDQRVAPALLVKHLSYGKAESLRRNYPEALIIGSDQLFVDLRGRILGKPGSRSAAIKQLQAMSGLSHTFYTGVTVYDAKTRESISDFSTYTVTLRALTDEQIISYLDRDRPFRCAGSFKIEGLGIALMEKMEGEDYTSLIGLPLIKLTSLLSQFGVDVL
jgi:septum formation protein